MTRKPADRLALPAWLGTAAIALVGAAGLTWAAYSRAMRRTRERLRNASLLVPSPLGDIEYIEGGTGPPVLVVHGSGGGFDHGALFAKIVLDDQFHWIAPSRFGYLRSAIPANPTLELQAQAFAHLLDHLKIDRAAVVAVSHGGPSALRFALDFPGRVSSLTLISCGRAPSIWQHDGHKRREWRFLMDLSAGDFRYWLVAKLFRRQILEMEGDRPEIDRALDPQQQSWLDHTVEDVNPASLRRPGLVAEAISDAPQD